MPDLELMTPPVLPVHLDAFELDIYGPEQLSAGLTPSPRPKPPWQLARPWVIRPQADPTLFDRIAWASPNPSDLTTFDSGAVGIELNNLADSTWSQDEYDFQAPTLLQRDIGLSDGAKNSFARMVEHRRAIAATTPAICMPNVVTTGRLEAGYTIVHVATGITVSFTIHTNGFGQVVAKSYSNDLKPAALPDRSPSHFYGYGIGRRLYQGAHALWPKVRWADYAARSTSKALRSALHQFDPFIWQDISCDVCADRSVDWWTWPRNDISHAHAKVPVR